MKVVFLVLATALALYNPPTEHPAMKADANTSKPVSLVEVKFSSPDKNQDGKLSTSELGSAISGLQAQKDELPAIRLAAHSSLYKLSKHEAVTSPAQLMSVNALAALPPCGVRKDQAHSGVKYIRREGHYTCAEMVHEHGERFSACFQGTDGRGSGVNELKKECPVSCGQCDPARPCKDQADSGVENPDTGGYYTCAEIMSLENGVCRNKDGPYVGALTKTCPDSCGFCTPREDSGGCFSGGSTLRLESGATRTMADLVPGDRILTSDRAGLLSFSDVAFLPHGPNHEPADFVAVETAGGKRVFATAHHLLLTCAGDLQAAASMVPGASCLRTVDGEELVTSATPARANGLYTAVAASGEFLVVDGIVASPFAVLHAVPHAFYHVHRAAYKLWPSLLRESATKWASRALEAVAYPAAVLATQAMADLTPAAGVVAAAGNK